MSRAQHSSFRFQSGDSLADGSYTIIKKIGAGWEGEVYLVKETSLGIECAVKLFFPKKNKGKKTLKFYARKLHKLRRCTMVMQYQTQGVHMHQGEEIPFLVSEFIEGEMLSAFVRRQPGKRLHPFQALHVLYALALGLEEIHHYGEYHGDLHAENIMIERHGLHFDLKVLDLFQWAKHSNAENRRDDVYDLICLFYELLGGKKQYAKLPTALKSIILGKRKAAIRATFPSAMKLRTFIETLEWN